MGRAADLARASGATLPGRDALTEDIEFERQVVAAAERYREVIAAMDAGGRPDAGQRAAVKAVGRALQLVAFVLQRAAAAGVTPERLGQLTDWGPELVRELLDRRPEPALVTRIAPRGLDPTDVLRAAASFEAEQRLRALLDGMLADINHDTWSPAAADLDDLRERLETEWRSWQGALGRPGEPPETQR